MAKEKLKLTDEQKEWAANLQWYTENKIFWIGETDERFFKEKACDGKYAVFSMNGEPVLNYFDTVICTDTVEGARAIEDWNPSSISLTINLSTLWTIRELKRLYAPHFNVLVEKWEHDKMIARYNELKKSLKPILKHFKDLK